MPAALYKVRGAVQGVGFRPFVYNLARELGIRGSVRNTVAGAEIRACADADSLAVFARRLRSSLPPPARIDDWNEEPLHDEAPTAFEIIDSDAAGSATAAILPDLATCPECLKELFDPANRRYRYPFLNCTRCGPRFSIVTALPYDRPHTTMARFALCPACRAEYENPADRRFHAQPNACPVCGPRLRYLQADGQPQAEGEDALQAAVDGIRAGRIVAVKGIGGFLLMADARNPDAIGSLRSRKQRNEKPFALLYPDLATLRRDADVSEAEADLLASPAAPIVLVKKRSAPCDLVAPGNPYLGVMLPYAPLHHLLLRDLGFPVVATSGNVSDEPICIDNDEAVTRLAGLADAFLVHDRPIARPVDDSVVRIAAGCPMLIRRARGYAPAPVALPGDVAQDAALAVGAHLKSTIALRIGSDVFVSQHLGDLETQASFDAFREAITALSRLYPQPVKRVIADLHPDYLSTRHALALNPSAVRVQHHVAHVVGCLAEHDITGPALGVAWDGTGLGVDGTIWGGEFFLGTRERLRRVASLRPFPLPGGDAAIREPRRSALGLLFAHFGDHVWDAVPVLRHAFTAVERENLAHMLRKNLHTPTTTSVGRLFDALAALTGLRSVTNFEGQSAMALEFASAAWTGEATPYPLPLVADERVARLDWGPLIDAVIADLRAGRQAGEIGRRFHLALAEGIVTTAMHTGARLVALGGGCFQNVVLLEATVERLQAKGIRAYWPRVLPTNDGGIAYGQIAAAAYGTVLDE